MKHGIHIKPSLMRCAREGFYFCKDCRHVVQTVDHDYLPRSCAECGSHRVHWNAPALANDVQSPCPRRFLVQRPGRQDVD